MTEHTIESLAEALYEGHPSLQNLAENMARQHGKASALSFLGLMGTDVQFFWENIANQIISHQIISHSKEWEPNDITGCCILSKKETNRLQQMQLAQKIINRSEKRRLA